MEAQRDRFRVACRGTALLVLLPSAEPTHERVCMASSERIGEGMPGAVRGTTRPAGRGDEKECVVTLRIRYRGELPDQLDNVIENRIHDFIVARGKNVFARVKATVAEEA
jgi:hypothetical protein